MTEAFSPFEMALFALAALAVCAAASVWLLRAAARPAGSLTDPHEAELAIYRDQLAELRRDLDAGRMAPEAMEAARLEIGRRLARVEARAAATPAPLREDGRKGGLGYLALAAGVVVAGVALYVSIGAPGRADMPFERRAGDLLARPPQSLSPDEIIVLLQSRAQADPKDAMPHLLMGQVMASTGRDGDALRAFQAALRRNPREANALTEIGAALTRMNGGVPDEAAMAAFAAAKQIAPDSAGPDFQLGLAQWNQGRKAEALAAWRALWSRLPADSVERITLAARVGDTLSQLDVGPVGAGGQGGVAPQDRGAMIATMIEARAARLAANPSDHGLRLSLARVRAASGDDTAAVALMREGVARAAGDPLFLAVYRMALGNGPETARPAPDPQGTTLPKK